MASDNDGNERDEDRTGMDGPQVSSGFGRGGNADGDEPPIEFHGGRWISAVPLTLFIIWAIIQSGLLQIGSTTGLAIGMLVSLIIGMFFVKGNWKTYANTIFEGMTQPVAATAIVAWL